MDADIRLRIAVPTSGMVTARFAYSLAAMVGRVMAHGLPTVPESSIGVDMNFIESSAIHINREKLVKKAIEDDCTHVMFIDDDMVFDASVLDIMMGRRQPIVVTNYLIKKEPAEDFVAVALNNLRVATTRQSTGLMPISHSGFGVSLFALEVFRNTPQPWFAPQWEPDKLDYTTEDTPCYKKLRASGYTVYLDQDASKLIEHVGRKSWTIDDWVLPKQPGA